VKAYAQWSLVPSHVALLTASIEKSMQHQLSIWEATMIGAVLRGGVQTNYTKGLSHGQSFDSLAVVSPFIWLRSE